MNLTASDGGLESCLALSQVPAEVGAHLKNALKLTSLKDFVHIVSKRDFERELKVIVEAIPGATPLWVARTRAAYKAALDALEQVAVRAEQTSATDLEDPLHKDTINDLRDKWSELYGF